MVRKHWFWPVLTSLIVGGFGLWLKSACAVSNWGSSAFTYTNLCYSDIGPLYFVRGLADGLVPYFDAFEGRHVEYPVLTGVWMWLTAQATVALAGAANITTFVGLTWIVSLVFIAITVGIISKMSTGNRESAWWLALSPALVMTLGINWDSLAVLSGVAALYFFTKNKPDTAAIMIGVGTAAKLFPALLLVPIVAHLIARRNFVGVLRMGAISFGTWAAINAPFIILAREGWWEFFEFSRTRGIDFGSIGLALSYIWNINLTTSQANTLGLVAVGITALFVLVRGQSLSIYSGAFLVVAMFAITNKVYSPQFWLWLTAILVLCNISRSAFIGWNIAQGLYFFAIWRFLLFQLDPSQTGGLNNTEYGLAIVVHVLSTAVMMYLVATGPQNSQKLRKK